MVERLVPRSNRALLYTWFVLVALMTWLLLSVNTDRSAQFWFAYSLLAIMFLLRKIGWHEKFRAFFLLTAAFLSLRYVVWRTTETIGFNGWPDYATAILLYVAEIYGITVALIGIFVNINPLRRKPVPLPADTALWPTVDVYIPSYNEPEDMLEITVRAAVNIRYPKDKLRVHLLDDGGTVQKRTQANPEAAAEAQLRHETLIATCERLGAHYQTRERNEHAKAGNINSAFHKTDGDLVLILDADHVPTVDFLENTVGFFLVDPKLFLVQTPHFFINPDPIEKNLQMFGRIPSENEMFYSVIQHGLDFWNSAFFCGSAAVLRRQCLAEVGGIQGTSITEDAETALELHGRGYHSVYLGIPMISGLQPETFTGFVVQRVRWAQGMVQIFLLKNPLFMQGLSVWQRICYFSSSFFWFFGYARVVFMLVPLAYLLFGLQIYNATMTDFLAYGLPHVIGVMLVSDFLFGKVRWAFVSELYELMQSFFSLPGIIKVLKNPRAPTFLVTPKGEHLEEDFISKLSGPFYLVYSLLVVGMVVGIWRFIALPEERSIVLVTMGWNTFNLILMNAAVGALFERRQRRSAPRMPANVAAELVLFGSGETLPCVIDDMSANGARLIVPEEKIPKARLSDQALLAVFNPALGRYTHVSVKIQNERSLDAGQVGMGIVFTDEHSIQRAEVVALVFGDSQRWQEYRQSRAQRVSIFQSLAFLSLLGSKYAFEHYRLIAREWFGRIWAVACQAGRRLRHGLLQWRNTFVSWVRS